MVNLWCTVRETLSYCVLGFALNCILHLKAMLILLLFLKSVYYVIWLNIYAAMMPRISRCYGNLQAATQTLPPCYQARIHRSCANLTVLQHSSSYIRACGTYTGCPRRNVPDFGRVFLMLNYTDITQNTYIQIWTVTEITAREIWNFDSCYTLIDYQIHIKIGRNMWFL